MREAQKGAVPRMFALIVSLLISPFCLRDTVLPIVTANLTRA
jgi:hypothetical protein